MAPLLSASIWMWLAAIVLGLLFGSFLNVCIARLPWHRSIVHPGSHCPRCQAPIRPWHNVPVLSWFALRGRCRGCRLPISPLYPLVEAGYAALVAACLAQLGFIWQAAGASIFCFFALGLLVMDGQTMLLPDAFTLPGLVVGLAWAFALPWLQQPATATWQAAGWALAQAAGSALAWTLLLLAIRWGYYAARKRQGLGLGDIKLVAMLGAWLGFSRTALAFLVAVVAAAGFGIASIILRSRLIRRTTVVAPADWQQLRLPFGAFLCGAGLFALFFGEPIVKWYIALWM